MGCALQMREAWGNGLSSLVVVSCSRDISASCVVQEGNDAFNYKSYGKACAKYMKVLNEGRHVDKSVGHV